MPTTKLKEDQLDNIYKLYFNEKLSFSQIAKLYSCNSVTIHNFFKRHKLKPRTLEEANSNSWSEDRREMWKRYMRGKQRNLNKRWTMSYKVSKNNLGEKNPMWKGGKTELKLRLRNSYEYNQWRAEIYKRDNFTCQVCGDNSGGNLNAHHKISFSELLTKYGISTFEEGLNCLHIWNVDNGITLCEKCHKQTDSYLYNPYGNLRERNKKGQFNNTKIKY